MSALSARASLACPHLKLNFEASASEIAAKSAALVAGLDAAVARIASGDSGDAGADWIGATDAVAAASAERAHGDAGVYAALRAQAPGDARRAEALRRHVALFEANGLGLDDAAARSDVAAVRAELGQLCAAFEQAINVDASYVTFAEAELAGCRPRRSRLYRARDGRRDVSLKAPTLTPVLQSCASPATRKRAMAAGQSSARRTSRLNRIAELRRSAPRR
ncbi:metalloendopeptidase [Aureococcus anophagefferens]|nr:metalloendopeptidase [Aureococcus anophagefferens]